MNDTSFDYHARSDVKPAFRRLGDLPFVFLSYDEPWAEEHWSDLKKKVPHAVRVHGVKGLDACHKAAAEAVAGDWLVTVDADTLVTPKVNDILVPQHLFRDPYRLDWLSRNSVNGLWSGNGSLKLWSKWLLRNMQTHEAAPEGRNSIDHDIGNVTPGQSGQLTRPERLSSTWPAKTAYHAFRAGFREAVFLRQMAIEDAQRRSLESWQLAGAARPLRIWCSVGRHAANGPWVLYGARLGLLIPSYNSSWQPNTVNDYTWLDTFWHSTVAPQFTRANRFGQVWNWDRLELETVRLGREIHDSLDFEIAEFDTHRSQIIAQSSDFSPNAAASRNDALGYRMMIDSESAHDADAARNYLEIARTLDHVSAFDNVGTLHARELIPDADFVEAAWNFRAAQALGSKHAADHLNQLEHEQAPHIHEAKDRLAQIAEQYPHVYFYDPKIDTPDPDRNGIWIKIGDSKACDRAREKLKGGYGLAFDPGFFPSERIGRHVIDPQLCAPGGTLEYAWQCKTNGRIGIGGVRFGSIDQILTADPNGSRSVRPTVLGIRGTPQNLLAAKRLAKSEVEFASGPDGEMSFLGRDTQFGDFYILALLHYLSGSELPENLEKRTNEDRDILLAQLSLRIEGQGLTHALNWTASQSAAFKSMLTDVAPRTVWEEAIDSYPNGHPKDCLRRTLDAVWGRNAV